MEKNLSCEIHFLAELLVCTDRHDFLLDTSERDKRATVTTVTCI